MQLQRNGLYEFSLTEADAMAKQVARRKPGAKRAAAISGVPIVAPSPTTDEFGDALTAGFKKAAEAAIQEAFASGLAVPGRENGIPVERRPDGKIVAIEDAADWSPRNWKSRP
jgi:hypothetical protein